MIFQSSKNKDPVGYIVEDGSYVNSSKFYRNSRNGVDIYQSLATDRFDHRILDAVAYNGTRKTYGEQAKKVFWETNNLPKVLLASLRFLTLNLSLARYWYLKLPRPFSNPCSTCSIQRSILEDRGRRRWGRSVEATMVVRVQTWTFKLSRKRVTSVTIAMLRVWLLFLFLFDDLLNVFCLGRCLTLFKNSPSRATFLPPLMPITHSWSVSLVKTPEDVALAIAYARDDTFQLLSVVEVIALLVHRLPKA